MTLRSPAPRPCDSCPYRCDVPSGVWSVEEYAKLPAYDLPTQEQPLGVFACHTQDGRVCAGWAACHDMNHALAVRYSVAMNFLDGAVADELLTYSTPVAVFASGAAAAAHGLAEVDDPSERAQQAIEKVLRILTTRERTDVGTDAEADKDG